MTFEDVAHLYLKSKIKVRVSKPNMEGSLIRELGIYDVTGNGLIVVPILHKLEDMTEEQAGELYDIEGIGELTGGATALDWLNRRGYDELENTRLEDTVGSPVSWLKLLSWGFDLFGLIESGEAIDAKMLEGAK